MPNQTTVTLKRGNFAASFQTDTVEAELIAIFGDQVEVSDIGLTLPKSLTFDDWKRGAAFFHRQRLRTESNQWGLIDWLTYGGESFCERDALTGKYKQTPAFSRYLQVAEATGYEESYLKQLAYIGRAIPSQNRVPPRTLSIAHHAQVVALPADEQTKWLSKAIDNGWTVSELRQQVRDHLSQSDQQTTMPLVMGTNLVGIATNLEMLFRQAEKQKPISEWPAQQRQMWKADAIKVRDAANVIIEKL